MEVSIYLIIITVIGLLIYVRYADLFLQGLKQNGQQRDFRKRNVSVIIAARNEEHNISNLLTSLVNQDYPQDLTEIIVANDSSNDRTAEIVEQFQQKWPNINLINVEGREKAVSPKKNALQQAIEFSSGEILLFTDADCIPGKDWIEAMVAHYSDDCDMVVGFSKTRVLDWVKARFVQKYEHFDFLCMFFCAAGGVARDRYFSCSGQNLSYTRKAFDKVGGFSKIKHIVSGDDVNMMQLMNRSGVNIRFAFSPASFMTTQVIDSWKQLLNQRSRWASNMKFQFTLNPEFFFYLVAVLIVTYCPIILLFYNIWLAIGILLIKYIFELRLVRYGFKVFHIKKKLLNFYPVWIIVQPVYMLIVATLGLFSFFRWKK